MVADTSEHELIDQARSGDSAAFRALYDAHVDRIFRFAAVRIGRQEAEDITAETFCRAWSALGRYEHRGAPFAAWLFRIERNLIASRGRRHTADHLDDTGVPAVAQPSFEDGLVARLEAADLAGPLRALPERHREVLELRFVEDLPVPEVATILDLTEEATRALTYRALKALRAQHAGPGERAPGQAVVQ